MIYELGPCELNDEPAGAVWTVAYYESGCYEGSGEAVSLMPDGVLEIYNLGHCSCYGPLEGIPDRVSVERYLEDRGSVIGYISNAEVDAKVFELLSGGVDYERVQIRPW